MGIVTNCSDDYRAHLERLIAESRDTLTNIARTARWTMVHRPVLECERD